MSLCVCTASFSPLSPQSRGFGGRVFLWSPWLHRCSSGSLSLSLSHCCIVSSHSSAKGSAVCRPEALPCLPYHEKAGADPVPQLTASPDTLDNIGSSETMCSTGFDSLVKMIKIDWRTQGEVTHAAGSKEMPASLRGP